MAALYLLLSGDTREPATTAGAATNTARTNTVRSTEESI
jgi:aspartate carbamoyltransferase catalytic subunit